MTKSNEDMYKSQGFNTGGLVRNGHSPFKDQSCHAYHLHGFHPKFYGTTTLKIVQRYVSENVHTNE